MSAPTPTPTPASSSASSSSMNIDPTIQTILQQILEQQQRTQWKVDQQLEQQRQTQLEHQQQQQKIQQSQLKVEHGIEQLQQQQQQQQQQIQELQQQLRQLRDGRFELSGTDPFTQYWEALKRAEPEPIYLPIPGPVRVETGEHFIRLPDGVRLFGSYEDRRTYYRRQCYPRLIQLIRKWFDAGKRDVLVSGNPGVGKTFMANELIREFQREGKTIVYENQEMKYRWYLPPNGRIMRGDLNSFMDELGHTGANRVVYICDCGKGSAVNPHSCNAWTIVLSSPNKNHYNVWLNAEGRHALRLFVPLWSLEEVRTVVPLMYPPRLAAKRDEKGEKVKDDNGNDIMVDLYEQRFSIFGGNLRFVLALEEDEHLMRVLAWEVYHYNLKTAFRRMTIDVSSFSPDEEWKLIQMDADAYDSAGNPSYQMVKFDFASDHILRRLVSRQGQEHQADLASLVNKPGEYGISTVSTLRGKMFQRYAIDVLAAGGTFRARWLNDPQLEDMWIRFSSTVQQSGCVNTLDHLQVGVGQLVCFANGSNFPTIDAVMRTPNRVHLIQTTIFQTAETNRFELQQAAITHLDGTNHSGFVLHYFLVPPCAYSTCTNPTIVDGRVGGGSSSNTSSSSSSSRRHGRRDNTHSGVNLPDNVHMIVLEIPVLHSSLPDRETAVGQKRKSRSVSSRNRFDADALQPVTF